MSRIFQHRPDIYDVVSELQKQYPQLSRQALYDIVISPWQTMRSGVASKMFVNMYYPNLGTFSYKEKGLNLMRKTYERRLYGFIERRECGKLAKMSQKSLDDFLKRTFWGYISTIILSYCYEKSNGYRKTFTGFDWQDISTNAKRIQKLYDISLASYTHSEYRTLQEIFMRDVLQKEVFDKILQD
jgi:hypothetical protein